MTGIPPPINFRHQQIVFPMLMEFANFGITKSPMRPKFVYTIRS
jgi:hypothetical protein